MAEQGIVYWTGYCVSTNYVTSLPHSAETIGIQDIGITSQIMVAINPEQAHSQGSILGVWNPQNVDLLDPKSGLFEPHPP